MNDCRTPPVHPPMNTPNNILLSLLSLELVPIEGEDPSLHRLPAPYPIISKAFCTGTAPIMGELPLQSDAIPKLDTIPRRIFTGEEATEDEDEVEEEATNVTLSPNEVVVIGTDTTFVTSDHPVSPSPPGKKKKLKFTISCYLKTYNVPIFKCYCACAQHRV